MLQRENLSKVFLHGFDFFKEIDGKIHYMEDTHKANHHAQVSHRSSTKAAAAQQQQHSRSSCHSPPTHHPLTTTHSHHHAQEEERICMDLVRQRRVAFL